MSHEATMRRLSGPVLSFLLPDGRAFFRCPAQPARRYRTLTRAILATAARVAPDEAVERGWMLPKQATIRPGMTG